MFVKDDCRGATGMFLIASDEKIYGIPYGTAEHLGNIVSIDDMDSAVFHYSEVEKEQLVDLGRSVEPDVLRSAGFDEYKM